jgi:hypothetical protein
MDYSSSDLPPTVALEVAFAARATEWSGHELRWRLLIDSQQQRPAPGGTEIRETQEKEGR